MLDPTNLFLDSEFWRVPDTTRSHPDIHSMAKKVLPRSRSAPVECYASARRDPIPKPPMPPQPYVWIPRAALGRDSVDVGIGYADIGIAGTFSRLNSTEESSLLRSFGYPYSAKVLMHVTKSNRSALLTKLGTRHTKFDWTISTYFFGIIIVLALSTTGFF